MNDVNSPEGVSLADHLSNQTHEAWTRRQRERAEKHNAKKDFEFALMTLLEDHMGKCNPTEVAAELRRVAAEIDSDVAEGLYEE